MSEDSAVLERIRVRIDRIDADLQRLLNERAGLALEIGKLKQCDPDGKPPSYYRPEREAQILARLKERNQGPLSDRDMARLFREILSCCLSLEQPLTLAYLGPPGTYAEMAALAQFGHFARPRPCSTIDEVFREVASGNVQYGVAPVENSTEGMVNHTLDCFIESPPEVKICAEVELPVHHAFLVHPDSDGRVERVCAHPQTLAQCRGWLDGHCRDAERMPVASNAEAALQASKDAKTGALAGEIAARRYGLRVAAANIEDQADNKTRFLVIGCQEAGPSGRDKTSLLVSVRNEPGALFRVLEPFHRLGISLSRVESRPARSGNWSYVFFIDFDGHRQDAEVRRALADIDAIALQARQLGSYPRSVL